MDISVQRQYGIPKCCISSVPKMQAISHRSASVEVALNTDFLPSNNVNNVTPAEYMSCAGQNINLNMTQPQPQL